MITTCLGVDKAHQVLETVLNALSIVFNLILLYLIKNYSTFRVPIYQFLLAIDACLDLALGIVVLVGQQVRKTSRHLGAVPKHGEEQGRSMGLDRLDQISLFLSNCCHNHGGEESLWIQ